MSSRRSSSGAAFLIPFGLVFVLAGLGVGLLYAGMLVDWFKARNWVEVPCIIESSTLRDQMEKRGGSISAKDTLMDEAEATYRYEFEGRQYRGRKVSLSLGADSFGDFQDRAADILREYQNSGEPYRCYVNPGQPSEAVIFREARWTLLLFLGIFPLVFPLVGGFISVSGLLATRDKRRQNAHQSRYPGEPWRWRRGWEGEWIPPQKVGAVWGLAVVTAWMSVIWVPMLIAVLVDGDANVADPVSLVAFLPVPVLLLMYGLTLRKLLQRKNGLLHLHVEPRPIVPGSTLEAWVAIPQQLSLGLHVQMQAEVRCVKEVTTSDSDSTTTSRETQWSDHISVSLSEATREARGSRLPLRIAIPAGLPAPLATAHGTDENGAMRHVWEMELRATGLRDPVIFDLPVFHTEESLARDTRPQNPGEVSTESEVTTRSRSKLHPLDLDADELTLHLAKRQITSVFDSREQPVSFDLDAARMRGARTFLIFFNIIWTGAFIAMLFADGIPLLFPVVWGVSSAGIWYGVVTMFQSKRVRFSSSGLEIETRLASWKKRQSFERRQLLAFSHRNNMTSGSTRYYQVRAETTFGKHVTVVDGITTELVAENLCRVLESWRTQA